MKRFQLMLRLSLVGCVLVLCVMHLVTFASVIGKKPPIERYKEFVAFLRENRAAIRALGGDEIGVFVTYPTDGAHFYMQTALAPIRTTHSSDMPVVLVLASDDASLDKWVQAQHRTILSKLGNGLALISNQADKGPSKP
jgi:hypothetical protein